MMRALSAEVVSLVQKMKTGWDQIVADSDAGAR